MLLINTGIQQKLICLPGKFRTLNVYQRIKNEKKRMFSKEK